MQNDSSSFDALAEKAGEMNSVPSLRWPLLIIVLCILGSGVFLGPVTPNLVKARESAAMQTTRTIALAMFQYANDNNGNCPTGHSSTEVFQQLLDGNYISDPIIFYVPMAGKTKPTSKQLKPENVSYDVTIPAGFRSPDGLPLVFLTGYRIEYRPEGSAIPLPSFPHSWPGIAVCYAGKSAIFTGPEELGPGGVINHVLPPDFDSKDQHFQQLTPHGPLPSR